MVVRWEVICWVVHGQSRIGCHMMHVWKRLSARQEQTCGAFALLAGRAVFSGYKSDLNVRQPVQLRRQYERNRVWRIGLYTHPVEPGSSRMCFFLRASP